MRIRLTTNFLSRLVSQPIEFSVALAEPIEYSVALAEPIEYSVTLAEPIEYSVALVKSIGYSVALAEPINCCYHFYSLYIHYNIYIFTLLGMYTL